MLHKLFEVFGAQNTVALVLGLAVAVASHLYWNGGFATPRSRK